MYNITLSQQTRAKFVLYGEQEMHFFLLPLYFCHLRPIFFSSDCFFSPFHLCSFYPFYFPSVGLHVRSTSSVINCHGSRSLLSTEWVVSQPGVFRKKRKDKILLNLKCLLYIEHKCMEKKTYCSNPN